MFELIKPHIALQNYLQDYCIVETNAAADFLPLEKVYPTGNCCLVLHYGTPSKFRKKNEVAYVESNLMLCGQQTHYYDLSLSGNTGMVLITFKPNGLTAFFDCPASEITNENVSLDLVTGTEAGKLADKLTNAQNNLQRISIVDHFLMSRMKLNKDFERIDLAVRLIENSNGQIKTHQLSQEVCLGIKQFERLFSWHVGVNPKKFANIIRFQHVLKMKNQQTNLNLLELAFENGYYDQSHFSRDFKEFTGQSPRSFFKGQAK
jgi:AraC-like DNA-binding protein